ncbi:MAG TPA: hypothetical protein VJZ91_00165 [Blastocatellia bacterium]|nr:hypothetical protein [Blastocatellia bacterium]
MDTEKIYLNGIDGATGEYLVPPMDLNTASHLIRRVRSDEDKQKENFLRRIWRVINATHLGLPLDIDPKRVEQAGWGIVFPQSDDAHAQADDAIKAALAPLIAHRRRQINNDQIVKEMEYHSGEDRGRWLARHGIGAGNILPERVPYYLLFVGSPERIPLSFLHQLDVEYAVGLLHFDTPEEYAQYAQSVIAYDTDAGVPTARQAAFFATRHRFDRATQMSADQLVDPLTGSGGSATYPQGVTASCGFEVRKFREDDARKAALAALLHPPPGEKPPSFLFTASHGMGWPKGHAKQRAAQGALLCQDWPGFGAVADAHYFAADDVGPEARVHGLIAFFFACYGAGTPQRDKFIHVPGSPPPEIAERPFIAALPRRLLAHPQGGALACIGHVERAWGYSIVTPSAGAQLVPFENAIAGILRGQPVGHAMRDFNERYAALSTSLASMLEELSFGSTAVSNFDLTSAWIGRNDAEGYLILGDPAVRLRVEGPA